MRSEPVTINNQTPLRRKALRLFPKIIAAQKTSEGKVAVGDQ